MSQQPGEFDVNPYAAPSSAIPPAGVEWLQSTEQSLKSVKLGVTLVYYSIVLLLLAVIGLVIGSVTANALGGAVTRIGAIGLAGVVIVAFILNFAGPIVCLAVPEATRGKSLITGSVVCQLLNLTLSIGVQVMVLRDVTTAPAVLPIQLGANILGALAFLLFVAFLGRLARYIGRKDLANRSSLLIKMWVVFMGLLITGIIVLSTNPGPVAGLALLVVGILGIVVLMMYVRLIESMKRALDQPAAAK